MDLDESEVEEIQRELREIRELISTLQETERSLVLKLQSACNSNREDLNSISGDSDLIEVKDWSGKSSKEVLIDYSSEFQFSELENGEKVEWEWKSSLTQTVKEVWGIEKFRSCQEAVCNAVLSNRDVLVIMPTGGGKSLTYQLPAIMSNGTTLVISPLVALMTDQIMHLSEAGVEAEMFNSSTSRSEASQIMKRLLGSSSSNQKTLGTLKEKGKSRHQNSQLCPIKLCYMYQAKLLARFVIDEAHCCSSMGHDFRPDYKQLSILKTLFPDIPIVALTATCPPRVMMDVLKILKLNPITHAKKANRKGTVLFTSPLNRPNLSYKVLKKSSSAAAVIDQITEWIKQNHLGSQGIIYTLSQKDTSTVAEGIRKKSNGSITTGIYHASLSDSAIVCATTAFGMGIDAPKVRFVIHHTLPKSIEGYYQESGRAGRDGLASDCLLFWKTGDLMRLSGMVASEVDGIQKLYSMARYAVDINNCRNKVFGKYFNASQSSSQYFESPPFPTDPCNNCDNCLRGTEDVEFSDLTAEAYQLCQVVRQLSIMEAPLTLNQLSDLMRGSGLPLAAIINQRKSGRTEDMEGQNRSDDFSRLEKFLGDKKFLKKDQTEDLILHLLLQGYMAEQFVATAYTVNSYLKLGPKARELILLGEKANLKRSDTKIKAGSMDNTKDSRILVPIISSAYCTDFIKKSSNIQAFKGFVRAPGTSKHDRKHQKVNSSSFTDYEELNISSDVSPFIFYAL
ncbi:P-loop containing nucleoside triphosphate hydrolase protein [Phakopsora pachyrhizi]|uniref:ATP-dependent DNA helicase n=1 Tax=Phakopsora pachyrhizi TaxID=170000 RepID=A0AAV0BIJ3_PHAPC|nr:P-loop containing nucleoside triphosphate hydrolase protein [Phakopsora pachyrhizi]